MRLAVQQRLALPCWPRSPSRDLSIRLTKANQLVSPAWVRWCCCDGHYARRIWAGLLKLGKRDAGTPTCRTTLNPHHRHPSGLGRRIGQVPLDCPSAILSGHKRWRGQPLTRCLVTFRCYYINKRLARWQIARNSRELISLARRRWQGAFGPGSDGNHGLWP